MPENVLKAVNTKDAINAGLKPAIEFEPAVEVEVEVVDAPPVYGVYKRYVDLQNDSWVLTKPLFTNEACAKYRRDDLNEISLANGLMLEYSVEEMDVEIDYTEARDFMYYEVEKEALGINDA